jgi:hypothetical protein
MRLPPLPPQLVSDAIEHCLAQVRLQRTDTARLEVLDPLKRLNQSVLDKIIGVGEIPRPLRQPTPGPSLERFDMSREEAFQRLLITRARPFDQMKSRFGLTRTGGFRLETIARILFRGHEFSRLGRNPRTSYLKPDATRRANRGRVVRIARRWCLQR